VVEVLARSKHRTTLRCLSNILLLLLLVVASNCAETRPLLNRPDQDRSGDLATRLASARELWTTKHITTYSFRVERTCFCDPRRLVATVHVVEGRVASVDSVLGDGVSIEPVLQGQALNLFTIEELFEMIEREDPGLRHARFDPLLGFPIQVGLGDATVDTGVGYKLLYLNAEGLN
jgi:hypothetical protein